MRRRSSCPGKELATSEVNRRATMGGAHAAGRLCRRLARTLRDGPEAYESSADYLVMGTRIAPQ